MGAVDFVILAAILTIVGAAVWYVCRSKKRGRKCIGCPIGCACSGKKGQDCCGQKK